VEGNFLGCCAVQYAGCFAKLIWQYRLTGLDQAPAGCKLCTIGTARYMYMKRFKDSFGFGLLLSLILPGAGHIYIREYLFGIFVLLIMVVAAALFFMAFLVELPGTLKLVLFGLPALFYLFSFIDLWKSAKKKPLARPRPAIIAWTFLAVSLGVSLLAPLSPGNFLWRNRPELFTVRQSTLTPLIETGDLVWVDRMAYRVNLFFLEQPIDRDDPDRWKTVRFRRPGSDDQIGMVIGLGGEEVRVVNDSLLIDGLPVQDRSGPLGHLVGELPLTLIDYGTILVVTMSDGVLGQSYQVPRRQIIGEVHRLF
jgi:signal peptidase I